MTIEELKQNAGTITAALVGIAVGLKSMGVWFKRQDAASAAADGEATSLGILTKTLETLDKRQAQDRENSRKEVEELNDQILQLTKVNEELRAALDLVTRNAEESRAEASRLRIEVRELKAELHQFKDCQMGPL